MSKKSDDKPFEKRLYPKATATQCDAMSYMVSAEDIKKIIPGTKIVKFPDLVEYNSIEELLPYPNDYAVIFFIDEQTPTKNIGHWTCVMRNGARYEFFDSYGLSSKEDLEHIAKEKRIKFGEQHDYLKELGGGALKHNPVDYQSWSPNINTCGRFVIMRILAFMAGITNPKEFYRFMKDAKKECGASSFDELAVKLTS